MPIRASVVVPTHNRASMLRNCVSTLITQAFPSADYEVIVVDDGSTDDTAAVVHTLAADATCTLRYQRQDAAGANSARNRGLAIAAGDPICFVDDDQEMDPGWLAALVRGAARFPDAGCLGGPIKLRAGRPTPWVCSQHDLGVGELDLGTTARVVEQVWGGNMAVRRAAVDRVGSFHPFRRLGHNETEWQGRLAAAGIPIVYVPDALVWHRRSAAELRLHRLARAQFMRGVGQARNWGKSGSRYDVGAQLRLARQGWDHWRATRCAGGLLEAARHSGRAAGALAGPPAARSEEPHTVAH